MVRQLEPYEVQAGSDLDELLEEVVTMRQGRLLVRDGRPVAMLQPIGPAPRKPRKKIESFEDDPLYSVGGIFASEEPTNVAHFKDEYIADAIERPDP